MKHFLTFTLLNISLFALPSGESVQSGKVTINRIAQENMLKVHAKGKAIINWDQFDIQSNESVTFSHARANQAILNRVTGGTQSQINGLLSADCPIYLINTNGVFIGTTATIQTAGFIASTADISDAEFKKSGRITFSKVEDGEIVNLGLIKSINDDVMLIARTISNEGSIEAKNVTLTTSEIVIRPNGKTQVSIRPKSKEGSISNSGTIKAMNILLQTQSPYECAINHTGKIEALSTEQRNGKVFLLAKQGGCVIDNQITSPKGQVRIIGNDVQVKSDAVIDVSSKERGGHINIGRGKVCVQKGAKLLADSHETGHGGVINVLSCEKTEFYGKASARGGEFEGNGGMIRISTLGETYNADNGLDIVDTSAPAGITGVSIFDPKFITITPAGSDPATGQTFSSDPTATALISGATIEAALNSSNVVIQANTDITVLDQIESTSSSNLELQAGRSIEMRGLITLQGGDFTALINDQNAEVANRDSGTAAFNMYFPAKINTNGGAININVGTFGGAQIGEVNLFQAELNAGGGNIAINGFANQTGSNNAQGVLISSSFVTTSGTGTITINGTGGLGEQGNVGVSILQGQIPIQAENGLIAINGVGGGTATSSANPGVLISGVVKSTGSGQIEITGQSGPGTSSNMGVFMRGSGALIEVADGNATITGTGKGFENSNHGIRLESSAQCRSSGVGTLTLNGTSESTGSNNCGIVIAGSSLFSSQGEISLIGQAEGAGNANYGFRLEGTSNVVSTTSAPITINGTTTAGLSQNCGVSISASGGYISSIDGNISLTGVSNGSQSVNQGVRVEAGVIESTGTGDNAASITITGTGSSGTSRCDGIYVSGLQTKITSIDGNITINGTATAPQSKPVSVNPPTLVSTTGTGTVNINTTLWR